jgi:cytochrome c oxidase cbb3-type subunit 4
MSLDWGNINGAITILLMLLFIGIWIWAWRKKHKAVFDHMAALPLEDDLEGDKSNALHSTSSKEETEGNHHD